VNKIYRPEIDGLRAVAVLAVIFYHAELSIKNFISFKGGFIGVDIFFVISGYLITSIILHELSFGKNFSFKYFYERRIRRILPVLILIIIISIPFAWFLLLPNSFVDFAKSIIYSLGFVSNFYFWLTGKRYGAESESLKPFLHTWSLSVEEQFYIIFPIILIIVIKFLRKYLIHVLILAICISLFLAQWGSKYYLSASFYLFPTRIWEIIFGSLLASYEFKLKGRSKMLIPNLILPSIGLLMILYSIINFNDEMYHPSLYTLLPITGVCLIIWFSDKKEPVTKILSSKLFVGTGLISYSLYLWHYPIFAFVRTKYDGLLLYPFLLIAITFILSIFSFYLVEKPSRNKKYKFKNIFFTLIISLVLILTICFLIIKNDGFKNRFPKIFQNEIETKILRSEKNFSQCVNTICTFNDSSNKKVFIIGDSTLLPLLVGLKDKVIDHDYQFITSIKLGCFYFPGFDKINLKSKEIDKNCNNNYFSKLKKLLEKNNDSIIIIGGRLPLYLDKKYFDNEEGGGSNNVWESDYVPKSNLTNIRIAFQQTLNHLSINNKILLIYPFPEAGWDIPKKFFNSIPKNKEKIINFFDNNEYISTSYEVFQKRTKSSFELLNSIRGSNIYRIYPHELLCNTLIDGRCITHDDKNIFYSDNVHPSKESSRLINNLIMKELEKIKKK
jgi:peptidoglycan/LPS O-acetylase OafA/YrhL